MLKPCRLYTESYFNLELSMPSSTNSFLSLAHEPTPKGVKGRAQNELKVLQAVNLFGHLRRSEIATAAWPNTDPKSAYVMAAVTVSRMLQARLLRERPNSLGGKSLVLATRGAAMLRERLGLDAITGQDLSPEGPQFFHRTLGTSYLLEKSRDPTVTAYGEYALIRGWGPVKREYTKLMFGKIPDGLVVRSGRSEGLRTEDLLCDWVEVESAFKPYEDVFKIFSMLRKSSQLNAQGNAFLNRVVLVYDSRQRHESQLLKFLLRFMQENPSLSPQEITQSVVFASCDIDYPLKWNGLRERTAAELLELRKNVNPRDDEDESPAETE